MKNTNDLRKEDIKEKFRNNVRWQSMANKKKHRPWKIIERRQHWCLY